MLAAGRLFFVSILASSWSLFDDDLTNVRPISVPKSRLCPSVFGEDAVDFSMRHAAPSVYWAGASASLFSQGQSCLTCRVFGTIRPVLGGLDFGVEGRSPRKVLLTLAKRDWPVVSVPWKDVSDECEEKTVYA